MEKKLTDLTHYQGTAHNVLIEARKHIRITGVIDVESFQEDEATVLAQAGTLTIWGNNLRLGKLNPDDGQVILEGELVSLEYEQPEPEHRSLFRRR